MEANKLSVKEYLGTGKIAKMFGVAPRTVAKWIDNEIMKGTRIPGSKHRRVSITEVIRFSTENGMPFVEDQKPEPPPADGEGDFDPLPPAEESGQDEADEPAAILVGGGVDAILGRKEV